MNNMITGIALFAIIAVLVTYLISRSKSVERVTRAAKARQDAAQAERDEAARRRMVHEADSYNEACSRMEPFCGEGKKP